MSWPSGDRLKALVKATLVYALALAAAFDVVLPLGVRALVDAAAAGFRPSGLF